MAFFLSSVFIFSQHIHHSNVWKSNFGAFFFFLINRYSLLYSTGQEVQRREKINSFDEQSSLVFRHTSIVYDTCLMSTKSPFILTGFFIISWLLMPFNLILLWFSYSILLHLDTRKVLKMWSSVATRIQSLSSHSLNLLLIFSPFDD